MSPPPPEPSAPNSAVLSTPESLARLLRRHLLSTGIPLALLTLAASLWDLLPATGLADRLAAGAIGLVATVLVVRFLNALLELVLLTSLQRLVPSGELSAVKALLPMQRTLIWLLGALVFLQNQGLQLTAVVGALAGAGLGIGFALQGPARDFFTYLTILLDRPFRIGDLLRFDDVTGRVLQVGLRSTQLRSIDGELVVVANSELLTKTLRNFGDQQERRVLQRLVLRRDSPTDAAARLLEIARNAVATSSDARFERCHLQELSTAGLVFELCYFLSTREPVAAAAAQQLINLELLQGLRAGELGLAEPIPQLGAPLSGPGTSASSRG
jgi:small-conductance mechanosensitive channel